MGGTKRQTGTTCCAPTSQRRLACALAQRGASVLADGFGPGTHRLPDTARRFLPSEGAHRFHRAVRPRHPPTVGPFQKDLEIRPKLALASTLANSKRDSSLRRPTAFRPGRNLRSQERSGKKKRRPAPLGMTVPGTVLDRNGRLERGSVRYQEHGQRAEFALHGVEHHAQGFERDSAEEGAVLLFAKNDRSSAVTAI